MNMKVHYSAIELRPLVQFAVSTTEISSSIQRVHNFYIPQREWAMYGDNLRNPSSDKHLQFEEIIRRLNENMFEVKNGQAITLENARPSRSNKRERGTYYVKIDQCAQSNWDICCPNVRCGKTSQNHFR